MVRAEARICQAMATRRGHRHLGNDLEINGKLAHESGPKTTTTPKAGFAWGSWAEPQQQAVSEVWYAGSGVRGPCVQILTRLSELPVQTPSHCCASLSLSILL